MGPNLRRGLSWAIPCLLSMAAPAAAQAVNVTVTAAPGTIEVAPGVVEHAWLYNGQLGPVVRMTEGQRLRMRLVNQLPEHTIVHFHGQNMHQGMDGVGGISRPEIAAGQEFLYEIDAHRGTYMFHPHSHHHDQLDKGLYGVLIVDPQDPLSDPASDIDQVIVLDEWNSPLGGSGFIGHIINGRNSAGQAPIVVQPGDRLRLRLINIAATTNYVVALDGHPMTVTHADGNRVQPVSVPAIPIGVGERYDVIVDCNNPGIWSLAASTFQNRNATVVRAIVQYAGQGGAPPPASYVPPNLSGGSLLTYAQLAAFWPTTPIRATPDRVYIANLGQTMGPMGMQWTINGEAWPNVTPFQVSQGEIVQLTMTNTTAGMMHLHPMHLHGHHFRILGTAGGTTHAPLRDTVLLNRLGQPQSTITVQFTADNPGRWLYHCHDMMHMMMGMIAMFSYTGDADGDGLPTVADMDPTRPFPVLTVPEDDTAFQTGGSGTIDVQWQPGQIVQFLAAWRDLPAPQPMAPFGDLYIDPMTYGILGIATVNGGNVAALPYSVPADVSLVGFRLGMQAIAGSNNAPGILLSTYQAFTIR
jgi:FtsP/CotA-like multicopper oxidase with cupredoxin domain